MNCVVTATSDFLLKLVSSDIANHQVNGYRGEKYMERIGLGIDGRQEERREQQMARDYGRLNGVIYSAPFRNPMLKLEQ